MPTGSTEGHLPVVMRMKTLKALRPLTTISTRQNAWPGGSLILPKPVSSSWTSFSSLRASISASSQISVSGTERTRDCRSGKSPKLKFRRRLQCARRSVWMWRNFVVLGHEAVIPSTHITKLPDRGCIEDFSTFFVAEMAYQQDLWTSAYLLPFGGRL